MYINSIFKIKMESIIVTYLSENSVRCSLNTHGRPRYGTLEELLLTPSSPSTVGTPMGNIIDNTMRQSKRYKARIDFTMIPELSVFQPLLKNLAQKVSWPVKFDVITYGTGDHFTEHRDFVTKKSHCATLLIFPPQANTHTGGTLTIKRQDNTEFTFESSKNTVWTFIAFHPNLRHSCSPVLSGQRIVFKTDMHFTGPINEATFVEREIPDYRNFIVDRVR